MESFTHQITLYEALWEMNIEENNNLSFATQPKFAMVYTLKIQRLYFIIQKKILYRWFHINGNTLYALEILFPFYISSIQKCLLTATTISD